MCEVDFVVRAPDGKEVEELTRKDIIKALRAKIPIEQVLSRLNRQNNEHRMNNFRGTEHQQPQQFGQQQRTEQPRPQMPEQRQAPRNDRPQEQRFPQQDRNTIQRSQDTTQILSPTEISRKLLSRDRDRGPQLKPLIVEDDPTLGIKDIRSNAPEGVDTIPMIKHTGSGEAVEPEQKYMDALGELHNTLRGRLYDNSGAVMAEMPIRELIETIQDASQIDVVVFDGIITQRLIELAKKKGVKAIYGIRAGQVSRVFEGMLLYTKEQGRL